MTERMSQTQWIPEPVEEKTPVSVYPLYSRIRLKGIESSVPTVAEVTQVPILKPIGQVSWVDRQSAANIATNPSLLDTNADPAQADTLLTARRLHARRLGYVLIVMTSALLAGVAVVLLWSLL